MTANKIDGRAIAKAIQQEIAEEVARLKAEHNLVPGLATVLVGSNAASQTYVRMKRRRCAEVGIHSIGIELPDDVTDVIDVPPDEEVVSPCEDGQTLCGDKCVDTLTDPEHCGGCGKHLQRDRQRCRRRRYD